MRHLVFAQASAASFAERLAAPSPGAGVPLAVRRVGEPSPVGGPDESVALVIGARGVEATVTVHERPVTAADLDAARAAETRGRAAGMALLAARCPTLWVVDSPPDAPEWLVLELCARLAFVALGPVLPPDHSTLLGVRSARERAGARH